MTKKRQNRFSKSVFYSEFDYASFRLIRNNDLFIMKRLKCQIRCDEYAKRKPGWHSDDGDDDDSNDDDDDRREWLIMM